MYYDALLNNLMMLSPEIDVRINELVSSATQDEFDKTNTTLSLLSEAATMLIDMLNESGLYFHTDIDTILSNGYHIDFLMTLYKQCTPQSIEDYLIDHQDTCRLINAYTNNVAAEEYIVHLLEAIKDGDRSTYNNDLYVFFQDKVCSTEIYVKQVSDTVIKVYNKSYDDELVNITEHDIAFLMRLTEERQWYQSMMDLLLYNEKLPLNYKQSLWLATQFRSAYSLPKNLTILSRYDEYVISNKNIIDDIFKRIRRGSDFYVERYSDAELVNLSLEIVVGIILAQISDKRLFNIEPNFTRLQQYVKYINISDIIRIVVATNKD